MVKMRNKVTGRPRREHDDASKYNYCQARPNPFRPKSNGVMELHSNWYQGLMK